MSLWMHLGDIWSNIAGLWTGPITRNIICPKALRPEKSNILQKRPRWPMVRKINRFWSSLQCRMICFVYKGISVFVFLCMLLYMYLYLYLWSIVEKDPLMSCPVGLACSAALPPPTHQHNLSPAPVPLWYSAPKSIFLSINIQEYNLSLALGSLRAFNYYL